MRDGREQAVLARELVPGDVLLVEEGERVSADVGLLDGAVDIDMSTLTGESLPVSRHSSARDTHVPLLHARELLFTGTTCVAGTPSAYLTSRLLRMRGHACWPSPGAWLAVRRYWPG
jgi:P-type E1-E2 ATPase